MKRQIISCIHGGGTSCKRQGGSGELSHANGYIHPYPTIEEVGKPAGDPVSKAVESDERIAKLVGLEDFFDEDFSKSVLGVSMDSIIHTVRKSLYNFELDDKDGVLEFLELLPILDSQILIDVAGEIWPGYPAQDQHVDLLRMEIKGYMMDYLEGHGEDELEEEPEEGTEVTEEGPEEAEGAAEGAGGGATGEPPTPPVGTARAEGVEAEGPTDAEPTV